MRDDNPGWDVGRVVAGRYRLRATLGSGAMGVVWRADDLRLNREVALKQLRLPPGMPPDEAARARLRVFREGRVAARLQHANAVAVYDVADDDQGHPMLALEYLPSLSLAEAINRRGTLSPARVARIGAAVASALAAAHAAGIVHRDVKPGNVLLGADGSAKITDFGLSRVRGDVADGLVSGTPAFLSPEAAWGDPPGPESDVFSLGATLYAAVEGAPPFGTSDNPIAQLERVAEGHAPPPRRAGVLTAVLTAMLRDDPVARPSMARVADALADIADADPEDGLDDDLDDGGELFADGGEADPTYEHLTPARADDHTRPVDKITDLAGADDDTRVVDAIDATYEGMAPAGLDDDTRVVDAIDATYEGMAPAGADDDTRVVDSIASTYEGMEPVAGRAPRRWRRLVIVAIILLAIAVGILLVVRPLDSDPTAAGPPGTVAPTSAAPPASPSAPPASSAAPTTTTDEEPPPSDQADAGPAVDPAALEYVVTTFYTLLPNDPGGAWVLLGPGMQAQGQPAFDGFWATVKDLRIAVPPRVEGRSVIVGIEFTREGVGRVTETHQLDMVVNGGTALINGDQVLSPTEEPPKGGGPGGRPRGN